MPRRRRKAHPTTMPQVPSEHLPIEIITDILLRLPAESIVRCMCVCKSWYSLIRNPSFISRHLNQSASTGKRYILYMESDYKSLILLCDKTFDEVSELEVPFEHDYRWFTIVGSFNGLLCLTGSDLDDDPIGKIIYMCNPSIRKFKAIGSSSLTRWLSVTDWLIWAPKVITLGFGYYHPSNDYKLVRVWYFGEDEHEIDDYEKPPVVVEVYTLNTNSWKRIEIDFPRATDDVLSGVLVNGSVHWLGTNEDREVKKLIVSFDFGQEIFKEIMLPDYQAFGGPSELYVFVGVFKECLSLFAYSSPRTEEGKHYYLWMMNDYGVVDSWTMQFDIVVDGGVGRPLCFTNHDEVILEGCDSEMVSFDSKTREIYYSGNVLQAHDSVLVPYMESLVLLEGGNKLFRRQRSII